jgi:uncharacterized protein YhjY with autotransporter beta-barrel domain
MRAGIVVNVTRADRRRLEAIVADRSAPQKHVWRANIILATADGYGTAEIMRRSGKAKPVVWTWQARFMAEGVEGLLRDKTRKPGKPPLSTDTVQRVVDLALDITTDRTVTIAGVDQLRAKFNANAYSGRVEGGYRFLTPWMGITPYAAGQFTTFDLPAYAEQALVGANTFALAYGSKSVTASRSELGLRTDNSWAMRDAIFTLRGRFAWAHDFNIDRNIGATFQTLPGASFVVNGAAQAHDAALTTASAEMK